MRQLKTKRLVKFKGHCSYYHAIDSHNRQLAVAKRLDAAGFGRFVNTTELAPQRPEKDGEEIKLSDCTYYETSQPTLLTDDEYQQIVKIGVNEMTVLGIYEDERTLYSDIVFYGGCTLFVIWNFAALVKFAF